MEIIVQGKGVSYYTPDQVILNITFKETDSSYEVVLQKGVNEVSNFVNNILLTMGFIKEDMKTRNFIIREETKYNEMTRTYDFSGYSFSQSATLKFDYDKEKLARILDTVSKLQNPPMIRVNFGMKEEKELKRSILEIAYNDAYAQASAIAKAAGKDLKMCAKVDFKPFTTEYISNSSFIEEDRMYKAAARTGAAPEIVNTFTPEDIEISETLYCLWIAE